MAGMIESSGTGVFTAAISQSPVSDWHYYGNINVNNTCILFFYISPLSLSLCYPFLLRFYLY